MTTLSDSDRPRHTEVEEAPTVASVATVASTTEDLEAAEPVEPDRAAESDTPPGTTDDGKA